MAVADRRLWLTADGAQVVEDGDLRAAFLFAPPGLHLSDRDMERLGLSVEDGKIVTQPLVAAAALPTAAGGASEAESLPVPDVAPPPPVADKKRGRPKKVLNA